MSQIIGWHLELSRRCTLRCPACPRTFNSHLVENKKQDLDFTDLKRFFKRELLSKIRYLFFQGNLGEPTYHPEFHQIAEYFFDVQHLSVVTNGVQSQDFWVRVLETWPANSLITLSIDGLEDTNSIYRVGAPWRMIEDLFDLISKKKRKCQIEWKFLVFEHNRHQIEKASRLADSIGIDSFRIQQSVALDENTNRNGIIQEVKLQNKRHLKVQDQTGKKEVIPFCKTLDLHYISAKGEYFPCCWWAAYFQDQNLSNVYWAPPNISKININQALSQFKEFLKVFGGSGSATPEVCRINCTRSLENPDPLKLPNSQVHREFVTSRNPLWE